MCMGVPMQVIDVKMGQALCRNGEQQAWIDTRLIGDTTPGSWLLVFLGAAREQISAERAAQVRDALLALQAVASGAQDSIDHLFADLIERGPSLPPHLQAMAEGIYQEDSE